ncbi:unnamed protein product [Schistosoma curassoni]|uniref:Uncharacterized protein n=1 Tax=Schistosoma curassoni TaxID=6186 RepID=A0A183JTR9_9TREM|nr:unnamed protein product [Schistosoma curassoni]
MFEECILVLNLSKFHLVLTMMLNKSNNTEKQYCSA